MFISTPDEPWSQLQVVIEGFVDGILILTESGDWVQANATAQRLCRQWADEARSNVAQIHRTPTVPESIWQVCAALIDSRTTFAQQKFVIESEIVTATGLRLRVRAQWLTLSNGDSEISTQCGAIDPSPYLMVVLEDRSQSAQHLAEWAARKYHFTTRQAQVWSLRRFGCSYQEIAARLYITRNTVKKHLKDIYAKMREVQDWEEESVLRSS